jgi:hypothetical protein
VDVHGNATTWSLSVLSYPSHPLPFASGRDSTLSRPVSYRYVRWGRSRTRGGDSGLYAVATLPRARRWDSPGHTDRRRGTLPR